MRVCVLGLGYIGFPTACVAAMAGHEVIGVDTNHDLIDLLRNGGLHIRNEAGLAELAQEVLSQGRLRVEIAPEPADVFIIAVPTPRTNDGRTLQQDLKTEECEESSFRADLSYVRSAVLSLAPVLGPGNLVVLESTVPPGTTEKVVRGVLDDAGVNTSQVLFAHAPERVLPGNILYELVHNDRIVGGLTYDAGEAAAAFYRTFVKGDVVVTDATTAELVKLMENTYRDVNIALANEFALVCERLGVDAWEAIQLANRHPRVKILKPGPGVGGHCIAVDPYFVIESAPDLTPLIQAARRVNRRMPRHVVELFWELTRGIDVHKVAILGASYKANVGDERESPSLQVAALLQESGVDVAIHDPYIARYDRPLGDVVAGADAALVLTDHSVYAEIVPSTLANLMSHRLILDARGILDVERWRTAGFGVIQLGSGRTREAVVPA